MQPIETNQEPSTEPLVQKVMPVACRGLRHLRDQCLGIPQHGVKDWQCELELVFRELRIH